MHGVAFLQGVTIALIISVPLGPMALLCVRRTYRDGFWIGWGTSLGIALGDTIFATVAVFSLSFLLDTIHLYERKITIFGIIFLFLFGLFTIFSKIKPLKRDERQIGFFTSFYTSLLLTFSNLLTLVGIIALISWFNTEGRLDMSLMTTGIFSGVLGWFTLLNIIIYFFKEKIDPATLNKINKIIGIGICAISILMLLRLFL